MESPGVPRCAGGVGEVEAPRKPREARRTFLKNNRNESVNGEVEEGKWVVGRAGRPIPRLVDGVVFKPAVRPTIQDRQESSPSVAGRSWQITTQKLCEECLRCALFVTPPRNSF